MMRNCGLEGKRGVKPQDIVVFGLFIDVRRGKEDIG